MRAVRLSNPNSITVSVPELKGRNGLLFDDHFGGLSNCSGNVLYKAAVRPHSLAHLTMLCHVPHDVCRALGSSATEEAIT